MAQRGRQRRGSAVALVAAGLLVAAACGDADESVAPEGATTTEAGATTTEATEATEADDGTTTSADGGGGDATVDVAAFCGAWTEGESLFQQGPEMDEQGSPVAGALERFAGQLQPVLDQLAAAAPQELQGDVTQVLDTVGQALETGDQSVTQTPEFLQAETQIEAYLYDNCELDTQSELTAVEYEFQGLAEDLSAGLVGFQMQNEGQEVHELVLFRFAPGEERSIAELMELPEEEAASTVEFVAATVAPPGDTAYALTELEPGRYAAVCFVPVGTTSLEEFDAAPEDAPPHFAEGMHTEFTVS